MAMRTGLVLAAALMMSVNTASASSPKEIYDWTAKLQGDWKLAPADMQVGGATKKGPAAKMLGTDQTAMKFHVTGRGSAVQEILLPGTKKEMMTMYHCYDKTCSWVKATHYCAKKNQPEFKSNVKSSSAQKIAFDCDMNTELCNSDDGHVHGIEHEFLENDVLQTTYTIWENGFEQKKSIYRFVKK
ncbi:hypothetical protein J3998_01225 [Thiomicrorhabdus sp. 6S2-11]|uniref:DUF1579 domain-containing protein n=1 Tax=Thiomicrorhabdus marina TaxID=2818442 RepID=A0ABS3Q1I1_9GAMM|nr:hypothetical protein [Thiomicrorhabdus marina]MBO1926182.1 hypothetical protein [Thiomicrorhabdus marina]